MRKFEDSEDLGQMLKDMNERLRFLERRDRERTELIDYLNDSTFSGSAKNDANGNHVLAWSREREGLQYPLIYSGWRQIQNTYSLTSTSYVTIAEADILNPAHDVLRFKAFVSIPSGTTVKVRLFLVNSSTAYPTSGDGLDQGAGTGHFYCEFYVSNIMSIGYSPEISSSSNFYKVRYQMKINTGAGPVTVGYPGTILHMPVAMAELPSPTDPLFFAS